MDTFIWISKKAFDTHPHELRTLYIFLLNKIYDKHNDFDFDIVNFPFLDGDIPRLAS